MAELLSDDALVAALTELEGWSLVSDGKAIEAEFRFSGFNAAFGFMSRVALAADAGVPVANVENFRQWVDQNWCVCAVCAHMCARMCERMCVRMCVFGTCARSRAICSVHNAQCV